MNGSLIAIFTVVGLILAVGGWLIWQLLRQNGRILLRLDELEKQFHELEFGEGQPESEVDQSLVTSAPTNGNGDARAKRFNNRSLARSRIKRDGLKAGTPAPDFRLPRLDGRGELSLGELRGERVLLVFSDPHCGPCNDLAPHLEQFYREHPEIQMLMISRGDPKENRVKVKEHGLTFPILLQQQWEISRRYAMFATPIAYLIDESGIIIQDLAVGVEPILALLHAAAKVIPQSTGTLSTDAVNEPVNKV